MFGKEPLSNPDRGYQKGGREVTATTAEVNVTDERALKISGVWACIQLISNSVTGCPIQVYKDTDDGREPADRKHFLKELLCVSPNQHMKPRDFRTAMTVQMALWGNAYAHIVYSAAGDYPIAIIPLRPGRMMSFIGNNGELMYHYKVEDGVKVFSAKEILHLKGMSVEGLVGLERNNYARESLGLAVSAETFAAKQFARGRPSGVLEMSEFLTKDQREEVRNIYEGISAGAVNANSLYVLEGGMQYKALDFAADQMQMIATREFQLADIARFFGVPGILIGAGSSSNSAWPASFEQQMLYYLTHTVQPYMDEWEDAVRHRLLGRRSDYNLDHDVSHLVRMDSTAQSNWLAQNLQNGVITRNEARVHLNMKEVSQKGADDLTAQVNLVPIDKLGEQPEEKPNEQQDDNENAGADGGQPQDQ